MFEIRGFPIPPSVNRLQLNIPRGRGRCRINSPKYRAFEHEVSVFELSHRKALSQMAERLINCKLEVSFRFYFTREKLFCKDGSVKRFDHHNLLKAGCDALAKVLKTDDRMFFVVNSSKEVSDMNALTIFISPYLEDCQ